MDLTDIQREQISAEIELLSREALDKLGLSGSGFLVVVNGGQRQDVRQVHFHLLTDGYDIAPVPSDLKSGIWTDVLDPSCDRRTAPPTHRTDPHRFTKFALGNNPFSPH